jgi:hypothetical protein
LPEEDGLNPLERSTLAKTTSLKEGCPMFLFWPGTIQAGHVQIQCRLIVYDPGLSCLGNLWLMN